MKLELLGMFDINYKNGYVTISEKYSGESFEYTDIYRSGDYTVLRNEDGIMVMIKHFGLNKGQVYNLYADDFSEAKKYIDERATNMALLMNGL